MRWFVAVVLAFACKKSDDKKPPPPEPAPAELRLFTEPEIAELEVSLMKRLDANAKRACPRPVLRGTPTGKDATESIVAFVEPKHELANCIHKVKDAEVGGGLYDLVKQRAPHVVAIDKECGEAFENAVREIASREDACSPYQPGRRVEPEEFKPVLGAAHMLGLRAQLRAAAGDVSGALWLLAEGLRAYDDLARGNVHLLPAMIATAGSSILLDHVDEIARTRPIAPAAAGELAVAFGELLAHTPRFGSALAGEADQMALHTGLVKLKPADWVPPGGTNAGLRELGKSFAEEGSKLNPRDEGAMMIAHGAALAATFAKACPETATLAACHAGLVELSKVEHRRQSAALADPAALARELLAKAGGSDTPASRERVRLEVQKTMLETLATVASPRYEEFAAKRARILYRIAAAHHALALAGKPCPKPEELRPSSATAAVLGDPLVVKAATGELSLEAPAWAHKGDGSDWTWRVACR